MRMPHPYAFGSLSSTVSIVTRVLLPAVACVVGFTHVAGAQTAPCTAAPPAPGNVAASVTGPGGAADPAVVTVRWASADAATSYRIEVGSTPGATNIASVETGTTLLSSEQMAANGTYYVRVRAINGCGVSAPSSEPTVTVTGAIAAGGPAARIVIANSSWVDDSGQVAVLGEVRGAWGGRAAPFVMVKASFFNSAGQEVGNDSEYILGIPRRLTETRVIDEATVASGESACFLMYTDVPSATVSGVRVITTWSTSQLENLRGNIVLQSAKLEAGSLDTVRTTGFVRNAGSVKTYFTHVHQDLRTPGDGVLGCDFAPVEGSPVALEGGDVTNTGMEPGQIAAYTNLFEGSVDRVFRVVTTPAWRESDEGMGAPASTTLSWQSLVSPFRVQPITDARGRALLRHAAIAQLRRLTRDQTQQEGSVPSAIGRR
jgi:hypothetical protein